MANGAADYRLTTTRYVRPGTYIGYVRVPSPVAVAGNPRFPCYLGRGSRLARVKNVGIRRAFVGEEDLTFTVAPPYVANLDHNALNDTLAASLRKAGGEEVTRDKWRFIEIEPGSGNFDAVEISIPEFDKTTTYEIDYQSVDDDVLDDLPFDELREMLLVGDTEGEDKYTQNVDYRVVTTLFGDPSDPDAVLAGSSNAFTDGELGAMTKVLGDTGDLSFNAGAGYDFAYSRYYKLECVFITAGPPREAHFELTVVNRSGGNSATPDVPAHAALNKPRLIILDTAPTDVNLSSSTNYDPWYRLPTYYETDGIRLDATFGGTNFALGDTIEWEAWGPGLIEFASPHQNTNQWAEVDEPDGADTNTSSGRTWINVDTEFESEYNRDYWLEVDTVVPPSGTFPNREAVIRWAGYGELPYTEGSMTIKENDPLTLSNIDVEEGISLNFNFGIEHDAQDTQVASTITAANATNLATAILLANDTKLVYNNHDNDVGPIYHFLAGPLHQVTAPDVTAVLPEDQLPELITLCLDLQTEYAAHIGDTGSVLLATMHYGASNNTLDGTTPADLLTCIAFLNDLKAKYERHRLAQNYVAADNWEIEARAPWLLFAGLEDREYTMQVTSVVPGTSISFSYYTDTFEGGWGSFALTDFDLPVLPFPDNLRLMVRNLESVERYQAADQFTWNSVNEDTLDWTLTKRASQTISSDDIKLDTLGNITGTPLNYYLVLDETPTRIIRVKESGEDPISYTWIVNTPYVSFGKVNPGVDVQVDYEWVGDQPGPGQVYYVTANRLRADSEYENPTLYLSRDDMEDGLVPISTDNHLYIMGDLAFETAFFGAYFTQVKSASGDEQFSTTDYRRAIDSTELVTGITDLVVLSYFQALGYAKASIAKMNDPFEAKERLLWVGPPIGTPIGDVDTPDSMVYLARKTLQFVGENPGRGNVILIGHDEVTRTLTLEDGTSTSLTLDGSYLAGYAAAQTASFADPGLTILGLDISSFDDVKVYTEAEIGLIGAASITYAVSVGSGIFRWDESVTVDTTAPDLNEISAMTQKHWVTREVRQRMNDALIGVVPPSTTAGIMRIQSFLVETLDSIVSSAIVAPYGQEEIPPTIRPISPSGDTKVFTNGTDKRLYHFRFFYNLRYPIKRLFGVYSVDTKFWDPRNAGG